MAKKRKVVKKKAAEPYFIGLNEPIELRKNILEPTKEVIQFLQSYEQFRMTKEEKTQTILLLKENLRLIKASISRLRKLLPKGKIKIEKTPAKAKPAKRETEEEVKAQFSQPLPKKEMKISELDSLEKELNDIESKLGNLTG